MNSALTRMIQHHDCSSREPHEMNDRYYSDSLADPHGSRWKRYLSKQGITIGARPVQERSPRAAADLS
jgi:hypothetical protein